MQETWEAQLPDHWAILPRDSCLWGCNQRVSSPGKAGGAGGTDSRGAPSQGLCARAAALPAVDEVGDGVVLAERGRIQVHADLHIVTCHDPHGGLVFILENLPL